jgi:hypothetical protein
MVNLKPTTDLENPIYYPFMENSAKNWKSFTYLYIKIKFVKETEIGVGETMWKFHAEMFKLYRGLIPYKATETQSVEVDSDIE